MKVLVINAGSSSLKFRLFDMPEEKVLCSGIAERIGEEKASIQGTYTVNGTEKKIEHQGAVADHAEAVRQIVKLLSSPGHAVIKNVEEVEIIGHRVVHGGDYAKAMQITPAVKEKIKQLIPFAPLHNPVSLRCIEVTAAFFPAARQVAVFDTAFHHDLPQTAAQYALPHNYFRNDKIRAYGFHGISHKYVTEQARNYLNNPDARMISLHLGNGCSAAAVQGARSLDTSMGFSPVSGLVMGTRSGDIDPSVVLHLMTQHGLSVEYVNNLLNKQAGLLGLTGHSDMRDVAKAAKEGDNAARFARELYAYRIKKYIGAYTAILNGLDALIFTAGVGEHDSDMRAMITNDLSWLQIAIDSSLNEQSTTTLRAIHDQKMKVKILVIPTNEELEIARQSMNA
jgi:acetate kinase